MNKNFLLHLKSVKIELAVIIIGFVFGCRIDGKKASVERIQIDQLTNSVNLSAIADSVHLIFLDGSVEPISIISHIRYEGDDFYISDGKQEKLNCYHSDGSFIYSINKIGKGPGEYLTISRFVVEKETKNIYIYDAIQQKMIKYDSSGRYRSEIPFKFSVNDFLKTDNGYLVYSETHELLDSNNQPITPGLFFINEKGIFEKKLFSMGNGNLDAPESTDYFCSFSDQTVLTSWVSDTIYKLTDETVTPYRYFDFPGLALPDKYKRFPKGSHQLYSIMESGFIYSKEPYLETENHIFMRYYINKKAHYMGWNKANHRFFNTKKIINDLPKALPSFHFIGNTNKALITSGWVDSQAWLDANYPGHKNLDNPVLMLIYLK